MLAQPPVVVGVDGSPEALDAVEWAAADARRRGRRLRIVHASEWPGLFEPMPGSTALAYESAMLGAAENVLADALERARATAPDVPVSTSTLTQPPATTLIDAAAEACLVVVGHRGRGGFTGLLLGSVGVELAAHAAVPVVVVRHGERPPGPEAGRVVIGIDGSHDADRALQFAFDEAAMRGVGLTAVHAYQWPTSTGPGDMLPLVYDADSLREEERLALGESLGGWAERFPDVDVRRVVARGRPAAALTSLSAGAELLVVGSRGRGGFAGLLLGSVSQAAIHHATCPVAVVR